MPSEAGNSRSNGLTMCLRPQKKNTYCLDDEGNESVQRFSLLDKIKSVHHFYHDFVKEMKGKDFTVQYIQKNGFDYPILFKDKAGLGLKVPSSTFSVRDICKFVGAKRLVDVINVSTQSSFKMTMKKWTEYYENPIKIKLLNVISLEFSHSKLENHIKSPNIVQELDWVDCVWPKHLKKSQLESTNIIEKMMYPKVQKYCLMSVKGCFTNFHIDFGGTSVWYHILKGKKVFWLIPPSEENLKLYEQWILSEKHGVVFFGDIVKQCDPVELIAGITFFIPAGWIHAVYTLEDSIVFGGNFLHSFGIIKQIRAAQIEKSTKVPQKYRYPYFTNLLWYVLEHYVYSDLGISCLKQNSERLPPPVEHIHLTRQELYGLHAILKYLHKLPYNKKDFPPLIMNVSKLITNVSHVIYKHKDDQHNNSITGIHILRIHGKKEKNQKSHKSIGNFGIKRTSSPKSINVSTKKLKCEE